MGNIITIKDISFVYYTEGEEAKEVLSGVTLDVERGSFISVIGKNGSGKSTLAKHINALLLPSKGRVLVNDFDTADEEYLWDIRQTAGMVFQNPDNQIVSSVVEDDVAFGPENLGVEPKEIRDRVNLALDAVEMGEFHQKAPHMLSGGQKQRIAIAGVVAMKPQCIIFDEPTAMLDPRGRKDVMKIIKSLNDEGVTTILITHFMEEAAQADRVVFLHQGEVAIDGTPATVFENVKKLREINLDVPFEVELGIRLRKKGIEIPKDIINREEMVEFLCQ